ncbi:hypothetical protein TBLA_0A07170 [Henningerozyma blattae CBS 6284]|uniref:HRDC domain-containing protein n=1 Tax=Henningerozyma blattae (strain ATCC 34711 / CBS 6284 / DSM 70876 / NBRC 10599 / NRRL Y-10934 / UCD 77-7) TaxID=1071380 RepID=I2GWK5_HENB6|nr:hypothetical protein TBLA_0A07170 [Tetrapisispora blattae CBS 6284]CCH58507.1 hypothetical protein TBLA_0A07170 [Tetrapisispora blattae CBS 6284]
MLIVILKEYVIKTLLLTYPNTRPNFMSEDNCEELLENIVGVVRASTALAAQDVDFYKSLDKKVSDSLNKTANDTLDIANSLLLSIDENCSPLEEGKDRIPDFWNGFSNIMDNLIEKSDHFIDALSKPNNFNGKYNETTFLDNNSRTNSNPSKRIEKPQLLFSKPVDNTDSRPFKPLLVEKPNALKPLKDSLVLVPESGIVPTHYLQPYEYEIDNQEYNEEVVEIRDPTPYKPWETTSAIWIDTKESLADLLMDLRKQSEIAVDLEHHDLRSYYGITCLMQISTREQDYIVDTISLRDDLIVLNEIFTNPNITKVFHGASMDIIWLQRDLGLYIVSLFDTFHASKALGLARHSLAYLLENYASFKTSKKYQLADWRRRPLTNNMLAYARSDTHFLLNIFDQLRNTLIKQNKLAGVLHESRNVAKRRFEYLKFRPTVPLPNLYTLIEKEAPWKSLLIQYNIQDEKEILVQKLWEWRDMIARRDDESPRYIMPTQVLISLISYTPTDSSGVISVSNMVTEHVRSNSTTLANLIKKALESTKSIPNSSDSSSTFNMSRTDTNVASLISITEINNICLKFNSLSKHYNTSKFLTSGIEVSSLLFSNIMTSSPKISDYSKDKTTSFKSEDMIARHIRLSEGLKGLSANNSFIYQPPVEDIKSIEITTENPIPTLEPKSTQKKTTKEINEDNEEIIVLKKVNRKYQKGKKDADKDSTVVVDYSKAKKIFQKKDETINGNSKKRKSFDPYNNDGDTDKVPRALKKRQTNTRGKNISYKR